MRIGFFADMYLPHVSGVTNHIRLTKRFLERQGHEVFLITFGSTRYEDDEPNVLRSPAIPWGKTGWNYGPAFSREVLQLLPTLDIMHTHHPAQCGSYLLYHRATKKLDAPLVFTNHTRYDLYADTYIRAVPTTSRHKIGTRYLSYFTSQCDLVVAPSSGIADWLGSYASCASAQVIPNGVELASFQTGAAAGRTRAELGLGADDVVLCYVGRVSHEKNIAYLLGEFANLIKTRSPEGPAVKLLVIGDGSEMDYARDFAVRYQVEDSIVFMGALDYEKIPGYMALADAFITGSVSEVHPLVVIEALAAGLPVIGVSSPGIADTIEHGKSGLLARYPESGALMFEAQKLVDDAALRSELATGASKRADNYCLEKTAGQLLHSYETLLA